jgi:hypothetical protein
MVQGLLFNRVKAKPAGTAIRGQDQLIINILTHKTKSPLARAQGAKARAKMALKTAIIGFIPITTLV